MRTVGHYFHYAISIPQLDQHLRALNPATTPTGDFVVLSKARWRIVFFTVY